MWQVNWYILNPWWCHPPPLFSVCPFLIFVCTVCMCIRMKQRVKWLSVATLVLLGGCEIYLGYKAPCVCLARARLNRNEWLPTHPPQLSPWKRYITHPPPPPHTPQPPTLKVKDRSPHTAPLCNYFTTEGYSSPDPCHAVFGLHGLWWQIWLAYLTHMKKNWARDVAKSDFYFTPERFCLKWRKHWTKESEEKRHNILKIKWYLEDAFVLKRLGLTSSSDNISLTLHTRPRSFFYGFLEANPVISEWLLIFKLNFQSSYSHAPNLCWLGWVDCLD